jgi:ubiquinone/menaquinone biosynthesis C-methylase UbiE
MSLNYSQIAEPYTVYRKPDPRIAERIRFHIQEDQRVLNVGAGVGSYEPDNCDVVAIDSSIEMTSQRRISKAALVQGVAEKLPFKDNIFDISIGILTIHHWSDIISGLNEMLRVSRKKSYYLHGLDTATIFGSKNIFLKSRSR